jgi:hypothetical protein
LWRSFDLQDRLMPVAMKKKEELEVNGVQGKKNTPIHLQL